MKRTLLAILAAALLVSGCASGSAPETSSAPSPSSVPADAAAQSVPEPAPVELIISAAASLTDCMDELKVLYESANRGVTILCNYGSSGALQQQIEQGAPADVFFSAGVKQMDALTDAGLMAADTVQVVLENEVVLIVPKDAGTYDSFDQLANPAVGKIGVGEPTSVPVGQYTQEIFQSLEITEAVQDRLVFAKDVREVLAWVETGNVTAGIVYATDARISDKVRVCCTAPAGSHDPVRYPVGMVQASKNPDAARAFLDFLQSDAARAIYEKYGFTPVVNE